MALVSSLVAKLETPSSKKLIGTAYPIAKGYIITAFHVFPCAGDGSVDISKTKVFWQRNDDAKNKLVHVEGKPVTGVIYASAKYDIVIAKCETPETACLVQYCLSFEQLNGAKWESFGFSKAGKDEVLKTRLKDPAMGEFFPPSNDDWIQQLESKGNASKVESWRGMSGAPVFIEGGNQLAAIITETPRKDDAGEPVHEDRLYAVSIPYLTKKCEVFYEKIAQLQSISDISKLLMNSAERIQSKELLGLFKQDGKQLAKTPKELAEILSLFAIKDFLRFIAQLQKENPDKKADLGHLVCTLMPSLFDDQKADEIRTSLGQSCACIVVPYASDVAVEMLMAKVDYREASIQRFSRTEFVAKFKLPMPPESGGDNKSVGSAIRQDAYSAFGGEMSQLAAAGVTNHLYREEVVTSIVGDENPDEESKIGLSQDALADRFEDKEASYYFILDTKKMGFNTSEGDLSTDMQQFVAELKRTYPHCAVIQCNSELMRQEASELRKLPNILAEHLNL